MDFLTMYARIWSSCWFLQVYTQCGGFLQALQPQAAIMFFLALVCFTGCLGPLLVAHIGAVAYFVWMKPIAYDSDHWVAHLDTAVSFGCILTVLATWREKKGWSLRGLTVDERDALVLRTASLVRPIMAIWYFGCAFWKLNSAFFDPVGSCPSLFFCQLLAAYVPPVLRPEWLVKLIVLSAPYVTVLVEGGIGLLVLVPGWPTYCALELALLLHLLITVTPPPNNVGIYGMQLSVRFCFLLPAATAQVFKDFGWRSCACTAVVFALSMWFGSQRTLISAPGMKFGSAGTFDWMTPGYAAAFLLYSRAIVNAVIAMMKTKHARGRGGLSVGLMGGTGSGESGDKGTEFAPTALLTWPWHALWWAVVVENLFFVYGLIPLGLMDDGPPKPFANLRTHGGSNHFFMPTGLILRLGEDHPSWFGGAYAGGILRVENTTSSHLNAYFPGEITRHLDPKARELCRIAGHAGQEFGPCYARLSSTSMVTPNGAASRFYAYTLPAFELRRLLAEARAMNESFVLDYTRLPHYDARKEAAEGMLAMGPRVRLVEEGGSKRSCVVLSSSREEEECTSEEPALLPPLGFWAAKSTFFWPHLVLPGREAHTGYCFAE